MWRFASLILLATFFWQAACYHQKDIDYRSRFTKKQQYYGDVETLMRTDTKTETYTFLPEVTVYFDFNQSNLSQDAQDKLSAFYQNVISKEPNSFFYVEGNTDTSGTQEYNLILSEKRANRVISYLEYLGGNAGNFQMLARGELNPIADDATHPELNRRVIVYRKTKTETNENR